MLVRKRFLYSKPLRPRSCNVLYRTCKKIKYIFRNFRVKKGQATKFLVMKNWLSQSGVCFLIWPLFRPWIWNYCRWRSEQNYSSGHLIDRFFFFQMKSVLYILKMMIPRTEMHNLTLLGYFLPSFKNNIENDQWIQHWLQLFKISSLKKNFLQSFVQSPLIIPIMYSMLRRVKMKHILIFIKGLFTNRVCTKE